MGKEEKENAEMELVLVLDEEAIEEEEEEGEEEVVVVMMNGAEANAETATDEFS